MDEMPGNKPQKTGEDDEINFFTEQELRQIIRFIKIFFTTASTTTWVAVWVAMVARVSNRAATSA